MCKNVKQFFLDYKCLAALLGFNFLLNLWALQSWYFVLRRCDEFVAVATTSTLLGFQIFRLCYPTWTIDLWKQNFLRKASHLQKLYKVLLPIDMNNKNQELLKIFQWESNDAQIKFALSCQHALGTPLTDALNEKLIKHHCHHSYEISQVMSRLPVVQQIPSSWTQSKGHGGNVVYLLPITLANINDYACFSTFLFITLFINMLLTGSQVACFHQDFSTTYWIQLNTIVEHLE